VRPNKARARINSCCFLAGSSGRRTGSVMAGKSRSESPRKRVRRLPKLKGADLLEITVRAPKKINLKGKKLPIPKKELEAAEE
jgi:hypothetical protein